MKYSLIFILFFMIIFLVPIADATPTDKDCNKYIEVFLNCSNPKVIKYLRSLTKNDINKILTGVRLTDGTSVLKVYIFLCEAKDISKGVHLYIFKHNKEISAYIWIDQKGSEMSLPSCPDSVSHESAYVLSGDVYTWKAEQSGDGVVHAMCVDDAWIKKLK